jgi:hypothetical protein
MLFRSWQLIIGLLISFSFFVFPTIWYADRDGCYCTASGYTAAEFRQFSTPEIKSAHALKIATSQSSGAAKTINISVLVFDGRNGKPLGGQHVLVFTGQTSDSVKTHAQHADVTTDKNGIGKLTIYPTETHWLQVFTDARIPCYPDPNKISFSVSEILSKGLAATNSCSAIVKEFGPGQLIIFTRPAHFMEKMKL